MTDLSPKSFLSPKFSTNENALALSASNPSQLLSTSSLDDLKRMQEITDTLPVLIAYVDAEERYCFNNLAYEEWIGVPRKQVTGRTLKEVMGAELYAAIAGNVAAALCGETVTYERDLTWPDGTTRFVRGTYAPQRGPSGVVEGFAVLVTDQTEDRRATEERRQAARRHAVLVAAQHEVAQAARDLDTVLNIVTCRAQEVASADGAVIEIAEGDEMVYRAVSGTATAHLGLRLRRAASLSGRCVAEGRTLSCTDTETDPRVDQDACRRIGVRSLVVLPLTFLGRTVGVLKVYSGQPNGIAAEDLPPLEMMVSLAVAALSAVSEDQAKVALSASEQRLHALITSVPVVLFALDAEGVFTQSEGKGLERLGLKPGELVGRSYREVYASVPTLLEGVEAGLNGEARQWVAQVGELFYETQCMPLMSADGQPAGLIGVAFDVSERVRAERTLRQSAARQRQFLRDVLASVTEGRLILCQSEAELPAPLPTEVSGPIRLTMQGGLRELRQAAKEACRAAGLADERGHDMITAVSEAGMNCVVHVGSGIGEMTLDLEKELVQARITDQGPGISLEDLPNATLKKGFTTAGTLGHGMKMMLQTADRVFLLTNSTGTRLVIEQERLAPLPQW